MTLPLLAACAVCLDLLLGDPRGWPHPVRAIGAAYHALDALADRLGLRTRWFGAVSVLLVAAVSGGAAAWGAHLPDVGWLVALYLAYAGLALGGLLAEGRRAAGLLQAGDVEAARAVVAGLVSRDVSRVGPDELWRALAESVAENANDAFVAPLCWLVLGGPAGLWVYKAVSTADSMWGYRTERHGRLGWFGARADDVLAFVPARLTAFGMFLAARLLGEGGGVRLRDVRVDAQKSASPNAGWPMATAAWLCGGTMGGVSTYFGRMVEKPRLGPAGGAWDAKRFLALCRLVLLSGGIVAVIIILLRAAFQNVAIA